MRLDLNRDGPGFVFVGCCAAPSFAILSVCITAVHNHLLFNLLHHFLRQISCGVAGRRRFLVSSLSFIIIIILIIIIIFESFPTIPCALPSVFVPILLGRSVCLSKRNYYPLQAFFCVDIT